LETHPGLEDHHIATEVDTEDLKTHPGASKALPVAVVVKDKISWNINLMELEKRLTGRLA
jgi:hypothetical protein